MHSAGDRFPLNYFIYMWRPKKIFEKRNVFKWWQILFLFVFLSGCLMIPVSLQLVKVKRVPISLVAPHVSQVADQNFLNQIAGYSIVNGRLAAPPYERLSARNIAAIDLNGKWHIEGNKYHQFVRGYQNALIFQKDRLMLSDQNGFGFQIMYPGNGQITFDGSKENLLKEMSQLWVSQYKSDFLGVVSFLGFMGVMIFNLLMLGAAAVFLWLTKRTRISDIHSLREAAAVVLISAGVPSIAAMMLGLVHFDIGTLTMVQSSGVVLMIAFVFRQTHFQDTRKLHEKKLFIVGSGR
ncbi:maltodextrose utilization protein MalA [Sporolactobacillus vineae]|uniref:maltodextrose utilization protein MalA n=1 Tax=Sporolactobacillus vineae TaxID=444463 RepID=UPI0012B5341F|nr:maltodextrose utilization protein MalA [Sporolactobacillus vineae]